ncbi:MAG: biotin/lipoyl-binding protein, partial [Syntrophothermus sp.]
MKKLRAALILAVSAGLIITILFLNKASREAQIEKSGYEKITVSVSPASVQEFSENFSIIGTVNASNDVTVVSETQGKVVKLYVKTGDYVKEGSVLADVDDELKQAAFLTAKTNHEKSRRDLERIEALYKEKNVS